MSGNDFIWYLLFFVSIFISGFAITLRLHGYIRKRDDLVFININHIKKLLLPTVKHWYVPITFAIIVSLRIYPNDNTHQSSIFQVIVFASITLLLTTLIRSYINNARNSIFITGLVGLPVLLYIIYYQVFLVTFYQIAGKGNLKIGALVLFSPILMIPLVYFVKSILDRPNDKRLVAIFGILLFIITETYFLYVLGLVNLSYTHPEYFAVFNTQSLLSRSINILISGCNSLFQYPDNPFDHPGLVASYLIGYIYHLSFVAFFVSYLSSVLKENRPPDIA
ncbi:hypothetical protein JJB07_14495 [Tumebacillus sp. ITR2]|uniref:Uncharacterized protein n=1 Tax=Tumebacillus amylolyticus TaxID=2801339 RepID=A0ABS1JC53_9BACL|nr:hypothetical protein [Tumebacillus amylolyticus]MBL0387847.1 hypothetical protein [Tumebacillus amylolyticus]